MSGEKRAFAPSLGTMLSIVAISVSGFTLWDGTLKQARVSVFVPAVAQYSAPYSNSNFEVVAIPVTLVNDGARTATVLSLGLAVTNAKTGATKRFYAADFGRWSMERTRAQSYQPFAPISLSGKSSRTESVLFYTRGDSEKPDQIIRDVGTYQFEIVTEVAEASSAQGAWGPAALTAQAPPPLKFERELRIYDARAFNTGTLPLYDRAFHPPPSGG